MFEVVSWFCMPGILLAKQVRMTRDPAAKERDMKGNLDDCRREVVASNREAAASAVALEDIEVMYVLETAVGGERRRVYELDLRQAIARLAEDLVRAEAALQERVDDREAGTIPPRHRARKVRAC
jgi:hypothetical protein